MSHELKIRWTLLTIYQVFLLKLYNFYVNTKIYLNKDVYTCSAVYLLFTSTQKIEALR